MSRFYQRPDHISDEELSEEGSLHSLDSAENGAMSLRTLEVTGKLTSTDGSEFIKWRSPKSAGLPYSAKFQDIQLHGSAKLLVSPDTYVAQVNISRLPELDRSTSFKQAKEILLKNLDICNVLLNKVLEDFKNIRIKFGTHVEELGKNSIDNVIHAKDLYHLRKILLNQKSNKKIDTAIDKNAHITAETKLTVTNYVKMYNDIHENDDVLKRSFFENINVFLQGFFKASKLNDDLKQTVEHGLQIHKSKSLEWSPSVMKDKISELNDDFILFVTKDDLLFFSNVLIALNNDVFESFLPKLTNRYIAAIENVNSENLQEELPITNQIYVYLCKSLTDVVHEINNRTSINIEVNQDQSKWSTQGTIQWKSSPSLLDKCLEWMLLMLLNMVNHFEPGNPSSRMYFPYKFQILENPAVGDIRSKLPIEVHVWLCLLDDTINHVFTINHEINRLCSCLLPLYTKFAKLEHSSMDLTESVRVTTHNTINFLALTGPFFHSEFELDRKVLLKQINYIVLNTLGDEVSFLVYRDLIEVFGQYLKQRNEFSVEIAQKLPGKYFRKSVTEIQNLLLQLMDEALERNVDMAELISFCRAYDELLADLLDLKLDWFVRSDSGEIYDTIMTKGVLELVQNKWQDNQHKCYRVTNVTKFSQLYLGLSDDNEMPRHYILETIKLLLTSIYRMMMKQCWNGGQPLSELEQISGSKLMILSVRGCLMYLCEQPDYINYDQFLEENSKPFETVTVECASYDDFKKRVHLIKESFWYLRNLNAIDINTALALFKDCNQGKYNEEFLRLANAKYCDQFEKFMGQNQQMELEERIHMITSHVKMLAVDQLVEDWDFEFKQHTLLEILAGLGAVWALHASKDVASTGQYLKPHCIQVLGVLRLLSADDNRQAVQNHLAQVLTGQGKSLVLAMAACVLALCGHSVVILCYSEYLASRDQQDFEDFYNYFWVRTSISYKTFKTAAMDEFNRVSGNAEQYIHECLGLKQSVRKASKHPSNPVLLIDEVDVFFNEELFGKTIHLVAVLCFPGLHQIQMEIWKLTKIGTQNIYDAINTFVANSSCDEIKQFNTLRNRQGSFKFLKQSKKSIDEKVTDNARLIEIQIKEMVQVAENVFKMSESDISNKYRLTAEDKLAMKGAFGFYSDSIVNGYYTAFVYIRLKEQSSDLNKSNYGYLVHDMGCVSYAKLPQSYPLILGVTGTLTTLSNYEKMVVKKSYNIHKSSVMPSFFGTSNLNFNEASDVTCVNTASDWMNTIYSKIITMVNAKRSVLIIFDTEENINTFRQQYAAQFDRLNIVTVNTSLEEKEKFIAEAGVSRTITLATREMGRGVDYKSSVTVEKNGGVHVIQTFFSLDIKEETQIKGRTARKDNRGSYELILCYDDLVNLKLKISNSYAQVTYRQLCDARDALNLTNDSKKEEMVQVANAMHEKTVDFYKYV
ncbi:uncharacterized protein LOC120412980 [Culex pipiens pallens]|uniref:uncharacterized protein LOC120412980 n=1 Tax=Culex pipiens pallens TaxID=42434 RepID=UPI001953A2B2|nr:uncharacterized protein LOC120412980 [Culex pipiens pallens]